MEIRIKKNGAEAFVDALTKAFDTDYIRDCKEYRLEIPEDIGEGYISAYDFDYGMSLVYFHCTFHEDLTVVFTAERVHPLHFNFCVEGEIRHEICDEQIAYQLNPLNGSISANPSECSQTMHISPNIQIVHTNLQILRSEYIKKVDCDLEEMHSKLTNVFRDQEGENSFLHEINYSVPTAECIKHIAGNGYKDLVRSSYAEAKSLELLALQLKQFADDLDPETRFVTLKRYDLDKILKAKEILLSDLQNAPTIQDLAKMSGVNQQKLKRGFKQVFGKTINRYLRDARLEAAKYMIMDGKSSIQDVAERVGYSNRGHFARKFREKYGLLPKDALQANSIQMSKQKEKN
ncbi:helix-turn-helix transcriptional regulator [Flavilitoribacter nigricans]|uniref:HTH araC/xylS-type domain-containing protein n=1 Tax=Flavilitoribacter nigricans (strain ATCC 23147 / DSM 23189 / NBRC 102662 / NCIMB 1420 / SS-2) TaxID=1122177 RepID=A0A2D0NB04_FLAN2|nr:AraC family transcriptional regulator [Flavilitoribacter nigricans]PHN05349.1 hypothetical protein CRP01_17700 [Flavilitoribacter nigricans DSM 23189 = NBRC 102662]